MRWLRRRPLTRSARIAAKIALAQQNINTNMQLIKDIQTLIDEDTMTSTITVPPPVKSGPASAVLIPTTGVFDLSGTDVGVWVEFMQDETPVSGVLTSVNASRYRIEGDTSITLSLKTPDGWSWSASVKNDVQVTLRYDIDPLTGTLSGGL